MSRKNGLNPWSKVARHVGMLWGTLVGWLLSWMLIDGASGDDIEAFIVANAVGAIIGGLYLAGEALYKFIVRRFERKQPSSELASESTLPQENLIHEDINNPWNARIKAGVVCGEGIGRVVFSILPIPIAEKPLMFLGGAVGGVLGGLIAVCIPWWSPSKTTNEKNIQQANPVSERIRSGAMFGSAIGIVVGAFVLTTMLSFSLPVCILFGAGLGAALGSLGAYGFHEGIEEQKAGVEPEIVSNPWAKRIRAGIQWGACLGILIGVLFPGLGIGLSITLSVIVGGALFSVAGGLISLGVEPLVIKIAAAVAGKDYDNRANPWGPRCRFGVALGTSIGMLIGCLILPGFVGATAGGAIGGLLGGLVAVVADPICLAYRGYYAKRMAAKDKEQINVVDEEYKNEYENHLTCESGNSYSERCRTGVLMGAAIGGLIGFFIFPLLGIYLGSAIGGILGAGVAYLIPANLKPVDPDVEENPYERVPNASGSPVDIENNGQYQKGVYHKVDAKRKDSEPGVQDQLILLEPEKP